MSRIEELCRKDVINVRDGSRLGYICDIEIDAAGGRVVAFVIYGKTKFFGLLGREEDIVIPWGSIQTIGEDTILVNLELPLRRRGRQGRIFNFFK